MRPRCLEAGVNVCNVTFALESTWDQTVSAVDEGFAKIEASPVLALARDTAEIEAALAAGRLAVVPGTQGSSMIGKELARVGILARLGFPLLRPRLHRRHALRRRGAARSAMPGSASSARS